MSTIIDKEKIPADDPLRAQLAHRLKRERETRGLTIAALAGLSGVSKAMISKVERAEASPTADLLGRLSGAFGLTVSTLLARAEADGSGGRISRTGDQAGWTDPETGFRRLALSPPAPNRKWCWRHYRRVRVSPIRHQPMRFCRANACG